MVSLSTKRGFLLFGSWLVSACFLSGANTVTTPRNTQNLLFARDSTADGKSVSLDPDALGFVAPSSVNCCLMCAEYGWCTSFFFTHSTGWCSLHATAFRKEAFDTLSVGTVYYRNLVDWCPDHAMAMYNRLAEMCLYFELDQRTEVLTLADETCKRRGMRIVQRISPLGMEAILNVIRKNIDLTNEDFYVGMLKNPFGEGIIWQDWSPLDNAVQSTYVDTGSVSQTQGFNTCGFIRSSVAKPLMIESCQKKHPFICEIGH